MMKNIKKIIFFSTILLFVVCFLFISSINVLAEEENPITQLYNSTNTFKYLYDESSYGEYKEYDLDIEVNEDFLG